VVNLPPIDRPSVHIVSDGLPQNTFVQAPDGSAIPGIVRMEYSIDMDGGIARVELTIMMAHIDAEGDLHRINFNCPCCRTVIEHQCFGGDDVVVRTFPR
jgi:hypothetical protein